MLCDRYHYIRRIAASGSLSPRLLLGRGSQPRSDPDRSVIGVPTLQTPLCGHSEVVRVERKAVDTSSAAATATARGPLAPVRRVSDFGELRDWAPGFASLVQRMVPIPADHGAGARLGEPAQQSLVVGGHGPVFRAHSSGNRGVGGHVQGYHGNDVTLAASQEGPRHPSVVGTAAKAQHGAAAYGGELVGIPHQRRSSLAPRWLPDLPVAAGQSLDYARHVATGDLLEEQDVWSCAEQIGDLGSGSLR